MLTEKFYEILDREIDAIIDRYKDYPEIARHKNVNQKKAYGFLVWFLEFYGHVSQPKNYITNGSDDASCDIIFRRLNPQGNTIYYVVQVKWFNRKNALGSISTTDVRKSLNDFDTIIRGEKQKSKNEKFNESHRNLLDHLGKNGKVKFIFMALARENDDYKDNVADFNKRNAPNSSVEVIDIERIKRDYIDLKYKEIKKDNPLEWHEKPDEIKISLRIERFSEVAGKGDIIKTTRPYRSYIVMVKPAVIYELFKTFGFLLFYRNIRNPFPESNFNKAMARTLKQKPASFWYYNNGITAVSKIIPEIGNEAREIEITGLQVINGAQTVFTVYQTYEEAGPTDREIMDRDALIMLRLVDPSDEDVIMDITRYTNSQNPMVNRDFQANEHHQVRLQNASFDTVYWYEKRRGEFRQVPPGIYIMENLTLASAYLAFFIEDVHGAVLKNDFIFIKRGDTIDREGLYDTIFTDQVTFEDMLASYLVVDQILDFIHPNLVKKEEGKPISWDFHDVRFLLALVIAPLLKLVFKEYLSLKLNEDPDRINLIHYILKNRIEKNVLENILIYVIHLLKLFDNDGKINLKAIEGKEAISQLVDTVYRKKTNEKLELRIDVQRMGVEFFEDRRSKLESFEFMRPKEYYEQNTIQEDPGYVFALMPPEFEKQYKEYIKEPIEKIKLSNGKVFCKSNIELDPGSNNEIWKSIQKAKVIIANITGFNPEIMMELGVALIKKGQVILIAEKSLDGKTNLPFNIRTLRVEFYEPDKLDEFSDRVVNQVEKWITPDEPKIMDPKVIKLMHNVLNLRREEKYDTALLLFESMDRAEPGNWYIYKEWGTTYKENKDVENAIEKLQKALEYAKSNKHKSEIYAELGVVYRDNNMVNDAMVAFEKAEKFDRDNADLYEKWAFLFYNMGQYQEAMNKMTMAVKLNGKNEAYKWKFEFYVKKFTDKNFGMGMEMFLKSKREEKTKRERTVMHSVSSYSRGSEKEDYGKTLFPNVSNRPENFDRFVKRHKPKEVLEGEIIHVDPNWGIYVGFELNIVGLLHARRLPKNFDINDSFKVGRKIKVTLLFIRFEKYQLDLDIAD